MERVVRIKSMEAITIDVIRFRLEKPDSIQYKPGQAVDVSIKRKDWENELRAFTFTSLTTDDYLEFCIKTYPDHHGVTEQLRALTTEDSFILHDVFGTIEYKGSGLFIAGGAGITPFIAIFKELARTGQVGENKLLFANKTKSDIILNDYFKMLLGEQFINVLSSEEVEGYEHGYVTEALIRKYADAGLKYFYLCGPDPMMNAVEASLHVMGVTEEYIVREQF